MKHWRNIISLLLMIVALQACASGSVSMSDQMSFSVQAASTAVRSGWVKKSVTGSPDVFYVEPKVVLSKNDITQAIAKQDVLGQPMVVLQLTPMGRLQLQSATQSTDRHLLTVIVNNYVVGIIDGSSGASGISVGVLNVPSMALAAYIAQQLSR